MLEYCTSNDIGIITYSPLCSGLITGNANKVRVQKMHGNDFRCHLPDFKEPLLKPNLDFIDNLRPVAQKNNMTIPQLAVIWVLRLKEITSAIVGARRPSQIHEFCLKTIEFPEEDALTIDNLIQKLIEQREKESHISIPGRILNLIKMFLSNLAHPISDEDRSPWSR